LYNQGIKQVSTYNYLVVTKRKVYKGGNIVKNMTSQKESPRGNVGSGLARKLRRALAYHVIGLTAALSSFSGYDAQPKRQRDEELVEVPEVGLVPKVLCDMGIASVNPKTASAVRDLYFLNRNYDQGRRVSSVPSDIALAAQNCYLKVLNGPHQGTYTPDNIWEGVPESRAIFAEKIAEVLPGIGDNDYQALNTQLKGIVDRSRAITSALQGRD